MLSNAVILILQETLEAALLISVLATVCYLHRMRFSWLMWGLVLGAGLASIYASQLQVVSEWFDHVGQEVVNAALQAAISALLVVFYSVLPPLPAARAPTDLPEAEKAYRSALLAATAIVMFTVSREGSEIVLYLSGLIRQKDHVQAVLMGSGVGLGIGLSIGFLMFYGLLGLTSRWGERLTAFLLALFSGNMLSQAAMQLIQADWLPAGQPMWDSSAWLPEHTVLGQLLYALVGYEATPPGWYVAAYAVGFIAVVAAILLRASRRKGLA
ncbi:MAG TPA: FTR1 family protein [Xanthomonadales bacterium]|nr:FTR1 family protein [Xanthomonadales bacterium]